MSKFILSLGVRLYTLHFGRVGGVGQLCEFMSIFMYSCCIFILISIYTLLRSNVINDKKPFLIAHTYSFITNPIDKNNTRIFYLTHTLITASQPTLIQHVTFRITNDLMIFCIIHFDADKKTHVFRSFLSLTFY